MSSNAETALLQLLNTLPAGANPYDAIAGYLSQQFFPDISREAAEGQLVFLAVALGLTALLVLVSLVVRVVRRQFWVCRIQTSPGKLIRPHASIPWSSVALVMLAVFEALVVHIGRYFNKQIQPGMGWWMVLPWCIAYLGGHVASWSLLASLLVHLQSTRNYFPSKRYAIASNVYGLVTPVLYFAVLLPLAVLGGRYYRDATNILIEINALLLEASSTWTVGQSFSILSLAPALPLLTSLEANVGKVVVFFRAIFIFYALTSILLVFVLIVTATTYLRSLKALLLESRRAQNFDPRAVKTTPVVQTSGEEDQVKRTLRTLAFTIGCFSLLGTVFTTTSLLAASDPLALVGDATRCCVCLLGPLYAFAIAGMWAAVLLVRRALDGTSSVLQNTSRSRSRKDCGVAVQIEVAVELERRRSHSSKPSTVPYINARHALSIPTPDGTDDFEWVEKSAEIRTDSSAATSPVDLDITNRRHLPLPPSPGYVPESPVLGRWSMTNPASSARDSYFSSVYSPPLSTSERYSFPAAPALRPVSEGSGLEAVDEAAEPGALPSFSYSTTPRVVTPSSDVQGRVV